MLEGQEATVTIRYKGKVLRWESSALEQVVQEAMEPSFLEEYKT